MIELFPFQEEDVEYLKDQKAVLIANEMGTGKTYETIARDWNIREINPLGRCDTLVIAPMTILDDVWKKHFEDLTGLPVTVIDPKDRAGSWATFKKKGGVFCVHWEALRLMPELAKHDWLHIIADEAHKAKNRKAQQTRALKTIKNVAWKTALTGTPVINRPDEMWSILNWIRPQEWKAYWKFFKRYVETKQVYAAGRTFNQVVGPMNVPELQAAIKPYYIRRRKSEVLTDLPDKYYTPIKVDLTPAQRKAYNSMRSDMIAWIGEQKDEMLPAPVVIAQLTRLQQFSIAFAEYDEKGKVRLREPSTKLDAVMELIDETDEQIVVFSRFKQCIRLLEQRLVKAKISHVTLTGDTKDRRLAVEKFQNGDARVFAGTIAAGGVGITLTAASRIVFTDREWSPALNSQAEDRLHRIGQKNAVQVIDIIARDTVDLGKMQRLELKASWIKMILGDPK